MCRIQSSTQSSHNLELHKYFEDLMSFLFFVVVFTVSGLLSFILNKHGKLYGPICNWSLLEGSHVFRKMTSGWIFFVFKLSSENELEVDIFQVFGWWPTGTHPEPDQGKAFSACQTPNLDSAQVWTCFQIEPQFIITSHATAKCLSRPMSGGQSWLDCSEQDPKILLCKSPWHCMLPGHRQSPKRTCGSWLGPASNHCHVCPLEDGEYRGVSQKLLPFQESQTCSLGIITGEEKDWSLQPCPKLPPYFLKHYSCALPCSSIFSEIWPQGCVSLKTF